MPIREMIGMKCGRLIVICRSGSLSNGRGRTVAAWLCRCVCGKLVRVRGSCFRKGGNELMRVRLEGLGILGPQSRFCPQKNAKQGIRYMGRNEGAVHKQKQQRVCELRRPRNWRLRRMALELSKVLE